MEHIKAEQVLPIELVKEIQKYIKGQYIYIPNEEGQKKAWGEKNGSKLQLQIRNNEIREKYKAGHKMEELCAVYYLSPASIKKIIYDNKRNTA